MITVVLHRCMFGEPPVKPPLLMMSCARVELVPQEAAPPSWKKKPLAKGVPAVQSPLTSRPRRT